MRNRYTVDKWQYRRVQDRNTQLRKALLALREFAQHNGWTDEDRCECGLDAVLEQVREALGERKPEAGAA
jgi:hypothetical protein